MMFYGLLFLAILARAVDGTAISKEEGSPVTCNEHDQFPEEIKTYTVDLNAPIHTRWSHITVNYKKELNALMEHFDSVVGKFVMNVLKKMCTVIGFKLPEEYRNELIGMAASVDMPLSEVLLFNVFYEFFTFCTSIVSVDKNGLLFHARNLDFGIFMGIHGKNQTWKIPDLLRPITVKIQYVRDGTVIAESVTFVGFIGILTGMKMNTFTISINERFKLDGGYIGLIKWLAFHSKGQFIGFLTRDILLKAKSYEEAKKTFETAELIAPVYIILGSPSGQGCVITRDRTKLVDTWELDPKNGTWFLLQTNYDHTKSPPFFDDRVRPGNTCMKRMGRDNLSASTIYNVLRTKPLRNQLTIYTSIMVPKLRKSTTYLQYCPHPCPLW